MVDLRTLPAPQVIEPLDFEAILARKKASFQSLWQAIRQANPQIDLPDYDVLILETDPVTILLEQSAYDELLLRSRINEAAKANLIAFSIKDDLVHLAADHGLEKLPGETDEKLRERIVLADQGQSCAGPAEWYKLKARSVSADVRDVAVYRPGSGPALELAILSFSNGGVAPDALIAQVAAVVTADDVRGDNDIVTVVRAVEETVPVTADMWLLPDTPLSVLDGLPAVVAKAWDQEGGIGFDLLRDWIKARLMVGGIYKAVVTSPAVDKIAGDSRAYALGPVILNFKGRMR